MDQPEKDEKIKALIDKAVELINNKEQDAAKPLIEEVLVLDPESLDGHILMTQFLPFMSDEVYNHLKFVLDKDITHEAPRELSYRRRDHVESFISHLRLKSYQVKEESDAYDAIQDEIISYTSKALAAGVPIPEIYDFSEVLLDTCHFDEVINIAYYLSGDKKATDLGWPGLDSSKSHDDLDTINSIVMDAFFESKRYTEGCQWILKRVIEKPNDHFVWYLFGETLAWLGYPEETARAWIIATEKGNYVISENTTFETLANMICDSNYAEKDELYTLVFTLRDKVPPEKAPVVEEVLSLIHMSMRSDDRPVPSRKHIEERLGMKLEDDTKKKRKLSYRHTRLFIPSEKSTHSIVQEAINAIDQYLGSVQEKKEVKIEVRERVAVGEGAASDQQTITLTQFGINITEQVQKGEIPPIVGRDREIDRMIRILARSEKNNPVLLGEAGVGKTAAVYGLAQRIVNDQIPDVLKNKIIIELNVGALVAGTTYRGDFEQRMNNIIKEMRDKPDIILFIDEFHTLIGAGDSKGQMDASNILKPALSSGEIRLIGATTTREYSRSIERDAAFERRFSPVYLNEISQQMTYAVLKARVPLWEKHHKVEIPDEALKVAINLTDQHIKHRHFPDKAIDLIDEACALARISAVAGEELVSLKNEHLKKICDQWTGATATKGLLPANYIDNIEQQLRQYVVGHEQIIKELSIVVTDEKLGLYTSRLPRVLYFYGLPDTGKTECAQALSKVLWPGEKERFLYIDMGLFNDPSDLNRLMGAPRGSIGSEEGGRLSIHISRNPYTLVYLYNFHKAHERIIRFFANLFREGLFSDGAGRSVYAGNAIFTLSSTMMDYGQRIGYTNGHDKILGLTANPDTMPNMFQSLNLPKDIFHFVKGSYFFNELNDVELAELISTKIKLIKNQPGIRELDPQFNDDIIEEIMHQYRKLPLASRNLRGLLQKYIYQAIDV